MAHITKKMTKPEPFDALVQVLIHKQKVYSYDTLISKVETENYTFMSLVSDDIQESDPVDSFDADIDEFYRIGLYFAVLLA
jgi:hypothetical protein